MDCHHWEWPTTQRLLDCLHRASKPDAILAGWQNMVLEAKRFPPLICRQKGACLILSWDSLGRHRAELAWELQSAGIGSPRCYFWERPGKTHHLQRQIQKRSFPEILQRSVGFLHEVRQLELRFPSRQTVLRSRKEKVPVVNLALVFHWLDVFWHWETNLDPTPNEIGNGSQLSSNALLKWHLGFWWRRLLMEEAFERNRQQAEKDDANDFIPEFIR